MSQLVACQNGNGIVLAADSQAIDFDSAGKPHEVQTERMIQLSDHAAILTGGVAAGTNMCHALKQFVKEEGLSDIEEIYRAALAFLGSEYERFMRKYCEVLPVDPINHIYFILAGYTSKDPQNPYRLYMLWTKKKLPQLDGDEITCAYTVPRRMALEYKLSQSCKENDSLDKILATIKESMENLTKKQEEVSSPLKYAFITKDGFKSVEG